MERCKILEIEHIHIWYDKWMIFGCICIRMFFLEYKYLRRGIESEFRGSGSGMIGNFLTIGRKRVSISPRKHLYRDPRLLIQSGANDISFGMESLEARRSPSRQDSWRN